MPLAYVKLCLINAETLAVEREVRLKQSELVTYENGRDRAVRTWQALTAKQETDYLDRLMREAVASGVPHLLAQ
ncbi:hypothetical protein [Duganella sp. BuS-21]|uniref:hypothetical protein n=1 Tax=Duganella sp. BuS-21 TaxID=2943848 RepID=UPI0035A5BF50